MLVIAGASGKLGLATLHALVRHRLIPLSEVTCTTSSDSGASRLEEFKTAGAKVVRADWADESSWDRALKGADKLFLISSARIDRDFGDPYPSVGAGREGDHFRALEAAKRVGVGHVYYTSLAFQNPSKSRVMTAHERTEKWLAQSGPSSAKDFTTSPGLCTSGTSASQTMTEKKS